MAAKTKKRSIVRYAKRPRQHKRGFTIPVAVLAGFAPLVGNAITGYREGGLRRVSDRVVSSLTGFDPSTGQWDWAHMKHGTLPILGGLLVHKAASKFGVNRALASAGVPWLRV